MKGKRMKIRLIYVDQSSVVPPVDLLVRSNDAAIGSTVYFSTNQNI